MRMRTPGRKCLAFWSFVFERILTSVRHALIRFILAAHISSLLKRTLLSSKVIIVVVIMIRGTETYSGFISRAAKTVGALWKRAVSPIRRTAQKWSCCFCLPYVRYGELWCFVRISHTMHTSTFLIPLQRCPNLLRVIRELPSKLSNPPWASSRCTKVLSFVEPWCRHLHYPSPIRTSRHVRESRHRQAFRYRCLLW